MRQPFHPIGTAQGPSPERVVGIGFVVLLHVVAIWALVSGLAMKIVNAVAPPDIVLTFLPKHEQPRPVVQQPKLTLPTLRDDTVEVVPPKFVIAQDDPHIIQSPYLPPTTTTPPGPPDSAAVGIAGTHVIPPYPDLARRLNEQGRVTLRLTISPQGAVTGADIERSSGFDDLDQTAVSWVLAHWRYKPAIQGGVPVTSTTEAVVVFDLKDAR